MLYNNIKIAFRNLWRKKGFSAINIFGLTLGIATCLLIMLFIQHELSYDRYNTKANRMVRVVFMSVTGNQELKEANIMAPVAAAMKADYPEVEDATRIRPYGQPRITYGHKTFRSDKIAFVDSNFFRVFTLPLVKGDAVTALAQPNTVVITRSIAKKYFGNEDPIGKVLECKDVNSSLTVTGLIDEVPATSHFHFDLFASMATLPEARTDSWMASNFFTYLVLPQNIDYKKLEAKMSVLVDKYIGPQLQQAIGVTLTQFRQQGNSIRFTLQPLTDIHLHSNLTGEMEANGDISYIYIFGAVALFMLLIACINFMNLSTAGASKRAKEVGIKKVVGSLKGQLVRQFLMESILLTAVALVLSVVVVHLALPYFNALAGQNLVLRFTDTWMLPALVILGLVTGVIAGSYPAFFLSGFKPIAVLKGHYTSGKKSISLRSGLVVFQFFISISLIVGTTVVYKQLSYIQHKELGYNKDQVVVIHETYWLRNNQQVFRDKLLQDPRVVSVTASGYLPAGPSNNNNFFIYADDRSTELVKTLRYDIDENYLSTMGMQLLKGRNFSKDFGADSAGIIVNETAARLFGWGVNPLDHSLTHVENDGSKVTYTVIGVVKDFHFRSLHELIAPLVMVKGNDYGTMIAKIKTRDVTGVLGSMQQAWNDLKAEVPFSYSFLDDRFNNTYKAEQTIGRILGVFAGLTIFVACLGLFGLAMFTAEQRTREIGIRKVLGANVSGLVALLSKDFLKLVVIAFCIATPTAWYVMNQWLQDFAYRTNISWWVFALAAVLAIVIAVVTISFQAIKAAFMNPVKSLRTE
jgi:putative ABC transport system permease protein